MSTIQRMVIFSLAIQKTNRTDGSRANQPRRHPRGTSRQRRHLTVTEITIQGNDLSAVIATIEKNENQNSPFGWAAATPEM